MAEQEEISILFFHDVLCAWCYALTPRVHRLVEELKEEGTTIQLEHRSFALAPNPDSIAQMFGSPQAGKQEILHHWEAANRNDDAHRIRADIEATRDFPYPYSTPALLACQAAEILGGEEGHGRYFDRVQYAHLTECEDVTDEAVLLRCAAECGFDRDTFAQAMRSPEARQRLEADLAEASAYGIQAVPSLVINHQYLLQGAQPYDQLKRAFEQIRRKQVTP